MLVAQSPFQHWLCNPAHILGTPFNQWLIVYVFLEHTSLYHLIRQLSSSCSHYCGNPSVWNSRWIVLSSTTLLPSHQHKLVHVCCYTLSSLLPSICLLYHGVLPSFMSRMLWEFHHLLRILDTVMLLAITILLGPRVEWTLLRKFNISSNPIASELLDNNSNLVCWLLNRHCDVGRATQPIFWVPLSTNV